MGFVFVLPRKACCDHNQLSSREARYCPSPSQAPTFLLWHPLSPSCPGISMLEHPVLPHPITRICTFLPNPFHILLWYHRKLFSISIPSAPTLCPNDSNNLPS